MRYGIYNPYTAEFWTGAGGDQLAIETFATIEEAEAHRKAGQAEWFAENGTTLGDDECEVRPVPKGVFGGPCNRTACQAPPAYWWHMDTLAYYCVDCAILLNRIHKDDAQRLFGGPLLRLHSPPGVEVES